MKFDNKTLCDANDVKAVLKMAEEKFGRDSVHYSSIFELMNGDDVVFEDDSDEEFDFHMNNLRYVLNAPSTIHHITPEEWDKMIDDVDAKEFDAESKAKKPKGARPKCGSYNINRTLSKRDRDILAGKIDV